MRADIAGLFWDDTPPEKVAKEVVKAIPPPRVWEEAGYLPYLDEALAFDVPRFDDIELFHNAGKEPLVFDSECYPNYFLVAFKGVNSGKICYEELYFDKGFNIQRLLWIVTHYTIVGFNSRDYDIPMLRYAISGASNEQLKAFSDALIVYGERGDDLLKRFKVKTNAYTINHIDTIEVAPLSASLKIYGGRLHTKRMQDLPFRPATVLDENQRAITRFYCVNDLSNTHDVFVSLEEQLTLRAQVSKEIGVDVRSKSDPQMAEAMVGAELRKLLGVRHLPKAKVEVGRVYPYIPPAYINFQTPLLNWVLDTIRQAPFVVDEGGSIASPPQFKDDGKLQFRIGNATYTMGLGGLHSCESAVAHFEDAEYILRDFDVASYYPKLILNANMYPEHLGPEFLVVYRRILERRLLAKAAGDKQLSESLKIALNGVFGKLANMFSIFYAPNLMIQVTLSGQLSILMLIERLELAGHEVISGNTDGIVVKCRRVAEDEVSAIVKQWEKETFLEMEEVRYSAVYSRDVNNYIAVKKKYDKKAGVWLDKHDGCKTKGAYANPWGDYKKGDGKAAVMRFHKNPVNTICIEAVQEWLLNRVPIEQTIQECTDIEKFVTVRAVKGGGVKVWPDGRIEYLGRAVRWYYAQGVDGSLVYASSGNRVPKSLGAKPLMDLPAQLPEDLDFNWYATEARKILLDFVQPVESEE